MCLDTVTKDYVVLSNDTTVYKAVDIEGRYPRPLFMLDSGIVFNRHYMEADTSISLVSEDGVSYSSGFHCYMNTPEFIQIRSIPHIDDVGWEFKEFIIPAGTEVVMGDEAGLRVLVSPILIDENVELKWYDWLWMFVTDLFRTLKQFLFG